MGANVTDRPMTTVHMWANGGFMTTAHCAQGSEEKKAVVGSIVSWIGVQ